MTHKNIKILHEFCNSFGNHKKDIVGNPFYELRDKFKELGIPLEKKVGKGHQGTIEFLLFSTYLESVLNLRNTVLAVFGTFDKDGNL